MKIIKQNSNKEYEFQSENQKQNGAVSKMLNTDFDIIEQNNNTYLLRNKDGKKFNIELLNFNIENKTVNMLVNGKNFAFKIEDNLDILLNKLGMNSLPEKGTKTLSAPMPGLVLKILVEEGEMVKSGQSLLVLEAMKMENIIKAQIDSVVKKINTEISAPVEKGQVLIEFE